MKKSEYKKFALLGITGGLLLAGASCQSDSNTGTSFLSGQRQLTDQELISQLSPEGKRTYDSLSADGKKLALQLANQTCKGQNTCKGLNSCKDSQHSCKGLGGCAGTSPGPFKDKNDAVKVASMASKRQNM